jgi:hypothetical protein
MKAPRGQGALLLYVDYDGVLHHENVRWHPRKGVYMDEPGRALFEHVHLLEDALAPYPEIKIVLSTSWVRSYGFTGAARRLTPALRERAIGATYHTGMRELELSFAKQPRGVQILSDAARRRPADWLAIDDDHEGWPVQALHKLVRTDLALGISAPSVLSELRDKLAAMVAGGRKEIL